MNQLSPLNTLVQIDDRIGYQIGSFIVIGTSLIVTVVRDFKEFQTVGYLFNTYGIIAAAGGHSSLWPEGTTFLSHWGAYSQTEAVTVPCARLTSHLIKRTCHLIKMYGVLQPEAAIAHCCLRSQHSWVTEVPICSQRLPQMLVAKGHNVFEVTKPYYHHDIWSL